MTFVQWRNRLTTHFSERIPLVKRRISVLVCWKFFGVEYAIFSEQFRPLYIFYSSSTSKWPIYQATVLYNLLYPKHAGVSELYNIIVTLIHFCAFIDLNYKFDRLDKFLTSASQISQFTFQYNAIYTFWCKCFSL